MEEVISSPETEVVIKSPFQLFSAFSEGDKEKFFGREEETGLLYQFVQESNVVLLYGESGTGKTSIVQCGLLNETKHFNWTSITVRKSDDINNSLCKELASRTAIDTADIKKWRATELMQEVFLKNFQPILLVFDQFEEIFVFGNETERRDLSQNIAEILEMRIPWKMVFVIREDFLAQLDVFEKELPGLFKKRLRIELMDKSNCRQVILKSFKVFNIEITPLRKGTNGEPDTIYNATSPDGADKIINTVSDSQGLIHLPYFQVFLDKLWKEAWELDKEHIKIDEAIVDKVGGMGDVLKGFLEEKVVSQKILNKVDAWKFLKLFVPEKGTTRKKIKLTEYTAIPAQQLNAIVKYFDEYKILTGCSENSYELGHESLVPIIQGIKLNEIRPRLTTPTIQGNPYKGLASFEQEDNNRFYGRKEAIDTLYDKISKQNFLVIVGNSGSGKSSLVKAGLLPLLKTDGYTILPSVRAGEKPLQFIEEYLTAAINKGDKKIVLLIDQYEELITRINEKDIRTAVYDKVFQLLEQQKNKTAAYVLKIIVTVRADFEPQFRIAAPLNLYWGEGKYIVPPFTREEIREVIEEPAYQAGLEFSPPSLVEAIAEEVYSSQATGLLPLMSFTLNALYEQYKKSGLENNLLLEKDYDELGGVIGGLQNKAEKIYLQFKENYPAEYKKYQDMMQNIILRMIYLSTGELAGQRILEEDLVYNDDNSNTKKEGILTELLNSKLIIEGINNKQKKYYEPAHDVLVRSWGQIWDWIGQIGKEKLFLRSRLTQAVSDYNNGKGDKKLLWNNNPWLDDLIPQVQIENSWLNKKEFDFVLDSKSEKDKAEAAVALAQQEKLMLVQDRVNEQEEKNRIVEEQVIEQKHTIRRVRKFRKLILTALVFAALFGVYAYYQRQQAVKNFKKVVSQSASISDLNKDLANQNISLNAAKDSLSKAKDLLTVIIDSVNALAISEKKSKEKALQAAQYANSQRGIALASVEKLERQIAITVQAQALAQERGDSLSKQLRIVDSVRKETHVLNESLAAKNTALSFTIALLNAQREQNVSQLVSISKRFENTDNVKAYQVAKLAYQKDSLSSEAKKQLNKLSSFSTYYYSKEFEGDYSSFSPNGEYILTIPQVGKYIKLRQNGSYHVLDSLIEKDDFITAAFSPSSQSIIVTSKNKVEIYKLNNLHGKSDVAITDEKNIISARYSPDENKLMILTKDHLRIYDPYSFKLLQNVKEKGDIVSAVFSEDGRRIIYGLENGTVSIYDIATGKLIVNKLPKSIINSYISPKGNCFIVTTPDNFYLYNSSGKELNTPNLEKKYGKLNSVVFAEDGRRILLSFNSVSTWISPQQQQQQQKGEYNTDKKTVVLIDTDNPRDINDNLANLIGQDDLSLFAGGYANIVIKNNFLFVGSEQGNVKLINLDNGDKKQLLGHQKPVNTISMFNGYILTSANDNTTKLWQYNTASALDKMKLLPELSAEELREFGVK